MKDLQILNGDALEMLRTLPDESVHCCVTSPPYWGLRDYGVAGQLGLEKTPKEYVAKMVEIFREVRRVLRKDGTCWVNLGDSYAGSGKARGQGGIGYTSTKQKTNRGTYFQSNVPIKLDGYKAKDLIGIPWLVAFALRADGWYLRSDIIWSKPNPMPESVTDRPTKAHEYIFLLSKSARYYYDAEAIKEPPSPHLLKQITGGYNGSATKDFENGFAQDASATKSRIIEGYRNRLDKQHGHPRRHAGFNDRWDQMTKDEQSALGCNKRSVWNVATAPYPGAHFATYPPKLIRPCILAGCPRGGTVLDPFAGSGTTSQVALSLGRKVVLIELNPEYIKLIERRTYGVQVEMF